jgi:hypothetical protein
MALYQFFHVIPPTTTMQIFHALETGVKEFICIDCASSNTKPDIKNLF